MAIGDLIPGLICLVGVNLLTGMDLLTGVGLPCPVGAAPTVGRVSYVDVRRCHDDRAEMSPPFNAMARHVLAAPITLLCTSATRDLQCGGRARLNHPHLIRVGEQASWRRPALLGNSRPTVQSFKPARPVKKLPRALWWLGMPQPPAFNAGG